MGKSPYIKSGFREVTNLQTIDAPPADSILSSALSSPPPASRSKTQKKVKRTTTEEFVDDGSAGAPTPGTAAGVNILQSDIEKVINDMPSGNNPNLAVRVTMVLPDLNQFILPVQLSVENIRKYLTNKYPLEKGPYQYNLQVLNNGVVMNQFGELAMHIGDSRSAPPAGSISESDETDPVKAKKKKVEEKKQDIALTALEAEHAEVRKKAEAQQVSPLERELADLKKKNDELERRLDRPQESSVDQLVKLAPLLAVLVPLFKREPDTAMAEAIKEMARTNEKNAERAAVAQKEMIQTMASMQEKQLAAIAKTSDNDPFAMLRKVKQIQDDFFPPQQQDSELDLDPNNILGSIAVAGIKGLYALARSGGPELKAIIGQITANMGKTPETVGPQDQAALDQELDKMLEARRVQKLATQPRQALPVPQPPQQRTQQAPLRRNVVHMPPRPPSAQQIAVPLPPPAPRVRAENVSTEPPMSEVQQPPPSSRPGAATVPHSQIPETIIDTMVPDSPAAPSLETPPPQAQQAEIQEERSDDAAALLEDDIRKEVEACSDTMLQDILSGRTASGATHRWIDEALESWPRDFKENLLTLSGGHIQVMRAIQEKMIPATWDKIQDALAAESNRRESAQPGQGAYVHNNFFNSFAQLLLGWKEIRE